MCRVLLAVECLLFLPLIQKRKYDLNSIVSTRRVCLRYFVMVLTMPVVFPFYKARTIVLYVSLFNGKSIYKRRKKVLNDKYKNLDSLVTLGMGIVWK